MDDVLARFHSFSTAQLIVLAVVTLFVISVIYIAVNNGFKWILILIIINLIVWYVFFGIKVHSVQEFIHLVMTAFYTMVDGIKILVEKIVN